jgi:hypothetical protein
MRKISSLMINKPFQIKFLLYVGALILISLIIFYCANLFYIWDMTQLGKKMALPENHLYFKYIDKQFITLNKIFIGAGFASLVVLLSGGLVLSHRIAGPLNRFTETLNAYEDVSQIDNISSRENDFFPEVYESFTKVSNLVKNNKVSK